LGDVSDFYQAVFITSIVAFVLLTVFCLAHFRLDKLSSMVVHILAFLDVIIQIIVVVLYSRLKGKMSLLDIGMYEYLRDNGCTDGALGRGVEMIANSYSSDQSTITIGYWFAIGGCLASVLTYLAGNIQTSGYLANLLGVK
jgi:hypothetical protein